MFFGLGLMELLVVLGMLLAPVVLVVLGVRLLSSRSAAPAQLLAARNRELEDQLHAARDQIEGMEGRLSALEEKLSFTQALMEGRSGESRSEM